MASQLLLGQRQVAERVRAYAPPTVLQDIAQEGSAMARTLRDEMGRSTSAPGAPRSSWYDREAEADSLGERVRQQRAIREAEMARQEAAFQATLQRRRETEAAQQDARLSAQLADVLSGMSLPDGPVAEAEAALTHSTKVRAKKKQELHQEWTSKVFDTIQDRLQSALNERDPEEIEARLKSQYDQYLHTTNTKVGVFRDVIIEADYNPLTAAKATIRIPTGDIRDPVKRDVLKSLYEQRLMHGSSGGGSSRSNSLPRSAPPTSRSSSRGRLGKETLDMRHWGELAVAATPFGHCNDGMGAYVVRTDASNPLCVSHVVMDHYDYPRGNEAAAAEVGPGKRMVPGPEKRRGRADLFDVVHHTCHMKPDGYTGGDQWLEARGKARAPGPEQRRGRRDLGAVMGGPGYGQPPPRPPPGAVAGDLWLDAKGKARLDGPEARRGRANLYETLHQSSNPYEGGSKVGDFWLEHRGKRVLPSLPPEAAAILTGKPPAPVVRRPPDARIYGTHLTVLEGQLTVKD